MAASKAMSNVKADRVTIIHGEMMLHKRRPELLRYAATWGVSVSTVDKYIGEAKAIIGAQANAERDRYFGEGMNVLRRTRHKAENDGDHRAVIAAQAELNKMLGLNAPLQVEDVSESLTATSGFAGLPKIRLLELREELSGQLAAISDQAEIQNGGDGRGH